MTNPSPIPSPDPQRPLAYYATQERLVTSPELAAIGFTLLAIPSFFSVAFNYLIHLFPYSTIHFPYVAENLSSLVLTVTSVAIVLHAFRKSPLRRDWLHYSLLALVTAHFLVSVTLFPIRIPLPGTPEWWAGVIRLVLLELFYTAFAFLWMIFLWFLASAMRSPILRIITLIIILLRALMLLFGSIGDITNSIAALSIGSPPPVPISFLAKVFTATSILSLLFAALMLWYAIAVYRFSRRERSLLSSL